MNKEYLEKVRESIEQMERIAPRLSRELQRLHPENISPKLFVEIQKTQLQFIEDYVTHLGQIKEAFDHLLLRYEFNSMLAEELDLPENASGE